MRTWPNHVTLLPLWSCGYRKTKLSLLPNSTTYVSCLPDRAHTELRQTNEQTTSCRGCGSSMAQLSLARWPITKYDVNKVWRDSDVIRLDVNVYCHISLQHCAAASNNSTCTQLLEPYPTLSVQIASQLALEATNQLLKIGQATVLQCATTLLKPRLAYRREIIVFTANVSSIFVCLPPT